MSILIATLMVLASGPQEISAADKKKTEQLRLAVEKAPEDAAANLAFGKHLCFAMGNWAEGLPVMAKGGDDGFAHMARKDLEPKENAMFSIEVADMWLSLEKANKQLGPRLRERALFHFSEAWPKINDPVWKDKTRERVLAVQRTGKPSPNLGPYPAKGWFPLNPKCNAGIDSEFVRSGSVAIKLIPPADPGPSGMAWFRTDDIPVAAAQKYKASCWVLTDGTEKGADQLCIAFLDAGDKVLSSTGPRAMIDRPIWSKLEVEGVVPEKAAKLRFGFNRGSRQGRVFVDDMSFILEGREILKNGSFEQK